MSSIGPTNPGSNFDAKPVSRTAPPAPAAKTGGASSVERRKDVASASGDVRTDRLRRDSEIRDLEARDLEAAANTAALTHLSSLLSQAEVLAATNGTESQSEIDALLSSIDQSSHVVTIPPTQPLNEGDPEKEALGDLRRNVELREALMGARVKVARMRNEVAGMSGDASARHERLRELTESMGESPSDLQGAEVAAVEVRRDVLLGRTPSSPGLQPANVLELLS